MLLKQTGQALHYTRVAIPNPGPGQALIRVRACGVCRTDLHIVDGELTAPRLPLIPGHQIVGEVVALGSPAMHGIAGNPGTADIATAQAQPCTAKHGLALGERVGVPWLGGSCGHCLYCLHQAENLCHDARFTGYQTNGGFAEYCVADARFCFPVPAGYADLQAAPLLCAGLIGYRAWCMALADMQALPVRRVGFYGFGAAAHLLCQLAVYQGREVYAFTSPADSTAQQFALRLGAVWAGGSDTTAPVELDSAIIFAPVGALVPAALRAVRRGGTVVCAGIHMSEIPQFPYSELWGERVLRSVANLTRRDGEEFLALAPQVPIRTEVHVYALERANEALADLRAGRLTGAAVIKLR